MTSISTGRRTCCSSSTTGCRLPADGDLAQVVDERPDGRRRLAAFTGAHRTVHGRQGVHKVVRALTEPVLPRGHQVWVGQQPAQRGELVVAEPAGVAGRCAWMVGEGP